MTNNFFKTFTALSVLMLAGCAYNGTATANFALINSKAPAINALGTNGVEAATGLTGGGTFDTSIPAL